MTTTHVVSRFTSRLDARPEVPTAAAWAVLDFEQAWPAGEVLHVPRAGLVPVWHAVRPKHRAGDSVVFGRAILRVQCVTVERVAGGWLWRSTYSATEDA